MSQEFAVEITLADGKTQKKLQVRSPSETKLREHVPWTFPGCTVVSVRPWNPETDGQPKALPTVDAPPPPATDEAPAPAPAV